MTSAFGTALRWQWVIVALYALIAAFAGLWSLPPLDRDEARFAQATAQMIETGDFVAIRFQDRERNKKPAGIYWLQAASVTALSDVQEREIWAYRIPSIIGAVLAAIATSLLAARMYSPATGLLAGLLIASCPLFAAEATIAKTDGVLLALICIAQYAFWRIYVDRKNNSLRWPLVFWVAQSLAILVKGPIGPLISLLTGAGLIIFRRKLDFIAPMRPIMGTLIMILIVGPWAVAIGLATEGRFFIEAVGGDMVGKIGEAQESHAGPPGYHLALAWPLFWPAAALLLSSLRHLWRDRKLEPAVFLLAWTIPAWLVFELAATKLPHYVLPIYPALAIMTAHAALRDNGARDRITKLGAVIYLGMGVYAAGLVATLPVVLSEQSITILCFLAGGLIAAAAFLIAVLFFRGRSVEGAIAASVLSVLFAWTLMTGVMPSLSKLALSPRLSIALDEAGLHPLHDGGGPVAMAGYSEPSAVFLIGTDLILTSGDNLGRLFAAGDLAVAIVESREADAFHAARGNAEATRMAIIDGLNYSNGKTMTIEIFLPSAGNP